MENDRRGLCIASMVLGITGIVLCSLPFISIVASILGLVFGCIGLRSSKGRGFAKAGLITGICGIVLGLIISLAYIGIARLFEPDGSRPGVFYYHYDSRDKDRDKDKDDAGGSDELPYSDLEDFYNYFEDYLDGYDDYDGYDDDYDPYGDDSYEHHDDDHHSIKHHNGMI